MKNPAQWRGYDLCFAVETNSVHVAQQAALFFLVKGAPNANRDFHPVRLRDPVEAVSVLAGGHFCVFPGMKSRHPKATAENVVDIPTSDTRWPTTIRIVLHGGGFLP